MSQTVFFCYASEDRDLMANFEKKFRDHNPDLEIWYDQRPDDPAKDATFHNKFKRYAETCDIAVIFGSAALANPNSYSSKHELPILKKRKRKRRVVLLGIMMSDFDVADWNRSGVIDFVQINLTDMPKSRQNHANMHEVNRKFAIYNLIEDAEQHTYHKILAQHIRQVKKIQTASNQASPSKDTSKKSNKQARKESASNKIVAIMTKHDSNLAALEAKLSNDSRFWKETGFPYPDDEESYVWYFCMLQSQWYLDEKKKVQDMAPDTFWSSINTLQKKFEKRNQLILELMDGLECDLVAGQMRRLNMLLKNAYFNIAKSTGDKTSSIKKETTTSLSHLANELDTISDKVKDLVEIWKGFLIDE